MKTNVLSIEGKKLKEIQLPKFFSEKVREEVIAKVLEAKKSKQPYSPMPLAGQQYSASGKLNHRRNVWKSQYKRGISRVPRKIMTRRGSQFIWIGATAPFTRGGRRAHPPKILSMLSKKNINKKEMNLALVSAISATANEKQLKRKYSTLKNKEVKNLPFVVEEKFLSLKAKEIMNSLKKILDENLLDIALRKRCVRSGKGKMRGRKYKKNAGVLIVTGNSEKLRGKMFETKNVNSLSVTDLAKGGQGRLTIYTENAISELNKKLNKK